MRWLPLQLIYCASVSVSLKVWRCRGPHTSVPFVSVTGEGGAGVWEWAIRQAPASRWKENIFIFILLFFSHSVVSVIWQSALVFATPKSAHTYKVTKRPIYLFAVDIVVNWMRANRKKRSAAVRFFFFTSFFLMSNVRREKVLMVLYEMCFAGSVSRAAAMLTMWPRTACATQKKKEKRSSEKGRNNNNIIVIKS